MADINLATGTTALTSSISLRPRVLMVQTQAESAGAQEISRLLGKGLEQRGYEVHHLFFYRRTAGCDTLPHLVHCAPARPKGPLAYLRLFARIAREIRRIRPDVVLTFQHYGNIIGAPLSKLVSRAPVIANQVSAEGVANVLVRGADRLLGLLGIFRQITVNSNKTIQAFEQHPAAYKDRIVHVPHGFEDKTAGLDKAEARARLGLPAEGVVLGCAARLHPMKKLDNAIRLLIGRPDRKLALAGQGADRERLEALAVELGVSGRVHFTGELTPPEMGIFLCALDVFVFPSAAETFGLAAVEAAQAGVPVVANRLDVLEEVLQSDSGPAAVFVDTENSVAFASAVAGVLDDPDHASALTRAGRQLASRYSLTAMIDAYEQLITDALRRPT